MKAIINRLVAYTKRQLSLVQFKETYRVSPKDFTRNSPLNFKTTALMILNMIKKSIRVEVMDYFRQDYENIIKIPARQSFTEAREKISYLAFKDFFEKSCELAVYQDEPRTYKGYRLFAADGISFIVGELEKLKEYFGESTTVEGKAMCRIGAVVDIMEESIVNAVVSPFSTGERAIAIGQIRELKDVREALFLFDRGYWSPELVHNIIANGQKFLMRLASNNKNVKLEDENGKIIDIRRYTFILPSGEEEILLTNIPENEVSDDELAVLYSKRWGIETKYLELKTRLDIDVLSGNTSNIVLQDIYSTMYISNLTAFICREADDIIGKRTADNDNKYAQKANRSMCIAALRKRFIRICLMDNPGKQSRALDLLVDDISTEVSYINKSKPRPRNMKSFKNKRKKRRNSYL